MREGIYRKTDAGRDEIRDRARKLPPQLRTVLLMVDGQRTLAELRQVGAGVKAPDDALERLLADGLIEPLGGNQGFDAAGLARAAGGSGRAGTVTAPAPAVATGQAAPMPAPAPAAATPAVGTTLPTASEAGDYVRLYEHMSEAVRAHLGLRGYFLQLKIERCTDAAGLRQVLPELRQALAKSRGEDFAVFWERALSD